MSVQPRTISRYGWRPDLPDFRDHPVQLGRTPVTLPTKVDLRDQCPPVYDQGQLGSCTANALAAAYEFDSMKQGETAQTPSRLFIYYNERVIEHTVAQDAGAMIRDGATVLAKLGAPAETLWPYDISKFADKPPASVFTAGKSDVSVEYQRVTQNTDQLRAVLSSGFPVVFGFTVYTSFESQKVADTGVVSMPRKGEQTIGGHAVMIVGYDNHAERFIVRNSWGTGWGMAGYFTMPYKYVTSPSLASDFWVIRRVS